MTTTDEVPWLTAAQLRAWVGLLSVAELLPSALDSQLRRDSNLTHFDYQVLAMLSEAPGRALRMTTLAQRTSATLPRLSHVAERLEARGLVERTPQVAEVPDAGDDCRDFDAHGCSPSTASQNSTSSRPRPSRSAGG